MDTVITQKMNIRFDRTHPVDSNNFNIGSVSFNNAAHYKTPNAPETIEANTPLTWNVSGEALKVYLAPGTVDGSVQFDLNNWRDGIGGIWKNWYVNDGILIQQNGAQIDCNVESVDAMNLDDPEIKGFYDVMGRKVDFIPNRMVLIRYANGRVERHLKSIYSP